MDTVSGAKNRLKNILSDNKTGFLAFVIFIALVIVLGTVAKIRTKNQYDEVYGYIKNEFVKTYTPYYQVIDVKFANYNESFNNVSGELEASFLATMIFKNYEKDPDTVEYIKKAKEEGSPYYETYYREYNMEKEANYELMIKAKVDGGKINPEDVVLYTNIAPKGTKWEKIEGLWEFILK